MTIVPFTVEDFLALSDPLGRKAQETTILDDLVGRSVLVPGPPNVSERRLRFDVEY